VTVGIVDSGWESNIGPGEEDLVDTVVDWEDVDVMVEEEVDDDEAGGSGGGKNAIGLIERAGEEDTSEGGD